jgi:hypothetical protein
LDVKPIISVADEPYIGLDNFPISYTAVPVRDICFYIIAGVLIPLQERGGVEPSLMQSQSETARSAEQF